MSGHAAEGHSNARLERVVVRGFVRDDPDWRPAVTDAVYTVHQALELGDHDAAAAAIDAAMLRAIYAAHRTDAVRDLGTQALDSTSPLRRLAWHLFGSRRAAARAAALNQESAAMVAGEEE